MGKLNSQSEPAINHFSHPHPLHLFNYQPQQTLALASCSGCKIPVSAGLIYTCKLCNYYLHIKCSQMPKQIKHPFHQSHVLSLLPKPTYPEGRFKCDACGEQGNGFSYHCKDCGIDLHILCASMPLSTPHQSHQHHLNLIFSPPYLSKSFSCDICKGEGRNHWLYRCDSCEFDAHLSCGTTKLPSAPIQPQSQPIRVNHFQQSPAIAVQAQVQPPIQMPVHVQQFRPPTPSPVFQPPLGTPYMNHPQNNFMNLGNPGVMGSTGPTMNNALQTNQGANDFLKPYNEQYLQALTNIMSGGSGGGVGGGTGRIGGGNAQYQEQFLQALTNIMSGGSGGGFGGGAGSIGGGNQEQYLQALMNMMSGGGGGVGGGGGSGGGGFDAFGSNGGNFDFSSLLGGGNVDVSSFLGGGSFDMSSLLSLMGGFGC